MGIYKRKLFFKGKFPRNSHQERMAVKMDLKNCEVLRQKRTKNRITNRDNYMFSPFINLAGIFGFWK